MRALFALTLLLTLTSPAHAADIVAKVNGQAITRAQLDSHFADIPANLLAGKEDEFRQSILDGLIEQIILTQEAERQGIDKTAAFKEQLEVARKALLQAELLRIYVDSKLTDQALMDYYNKTKESFAEPQVRARHILLPSQKEAQEVIRQLDKGADFAKLAKEKSKGPSAANGGDLGWFRSTDMVPAFANAAFKLAKGEYTKAPVQTQYGWHVIRVDDRNDKAIPGFDDLEKQLRAQYSEELTQDYISSLKARAKIERPGR